MLPYIHPIIDVLNQTTSMYFIYWILQAPLPAALTPKRNAS